MDESASLEAYMFDRHRRSSFDAEEAAHAAAARGREVHVRGDGPDAAPLAATVFDAVTTGDAPSPSPPRVVVVASATGVLRGYYATFAAWLSRQGCTVVTFDYRGMGDSRGAAASAAEVQVTMHEWGEQDLATMITWSSEVLGGGRPVVVIGHSVGGQLLGLLPAPAQRCIEAVVTVGAQSGDFRLWPMPLRLGMAALWYGVVPGVTRAVGYLPGSLGIGADLPAGVALEWARWCRAPGYLLSEDGSARRDGFARLEVPVLAFGFDDDVYAPPAAVDALLALFVNADVERRQLAAHETPGKMKMGHFGFFRPRSSRLWEEITRFLSGTRRD